MAITVYYTLPEDGYNVDILPAFKYEVENNASISALAEAPQKPFRCPALKKSFHNMFVVTCPYDYKFHINQERIESTDWSQAFYDENIYFRDPATRMFSLNFGRTFFFSEADSLVAEQLPPFWSETMLQDVTYFFGSFDIAKHFRPFELALSAKKDVTIELKEGKPLYYVRFNTDEEVKLQRFTMTPELDEILNAFVKSRDYTRRIKPLSFWYDRAKKNGLKKRILKLIKDS